MDQPVMVIDAGPMPKIRGRGRRKGDGSNIRLLQRLVPDGNPLFGVPFKKMLSIRQSARLAGMRIVTREMSDDEGKTLGVYAIQRRT